MNQYQTKAANLGIVNVNDYTSDNTNLVQYGGFQINELADLKDFKQNFLSQSASGTYSPAKQEIKKETKKMALAKNKRGLFQVILVDPKEKKVLLNTMVIADSIEDVLLEVDAGKVIKDANLSVADVDKIVNIIGQIRKTRKNKTGEVELINEDSDTKE